MFRRYFIHNPEEQMYHHYVMLTETRDISFEKPIRILNLRSSPG